VTKLDIVKKALFGNPEIVVVDYHERNYIPSRSSGCWSHTVNIFVAPREGVYSVDKLQQIMLGLIPDLPPTKKDDFHESPQEVTLGVLYFDEAIGRE
jgi:hypothetical protein